jgi:hypothetical protein
MALQVLFLDFNHLCNPTSCFDQCCQLKKLMFNIINSSYGRIPVTAPYAPVASRSHVQQVDSFVDTQDLLLMLMASGIPYKHLLADIPSFISHSYSYKLGL